MSDQGRETFGADGSFANIGVTVTVAAEFDFGVVQVKTTQTAHAHAVVDLSNQLLGARDARVVETARPKVLGVDAQAKSVVAVTSVNEELNLLERTANRSPGTRRVLYEDGTVGDSFRGRISLGEGPLECVGDLANHIVESGPLV